MKVLKDILYGVRLEKVIGDTDLSIDHVVFDSRKVKKGDLFIAINGTRVDGHEFIANAIESGAIAIIAENLPANPAPGITWMKVPNTADALGTVANNWFDRPSDNLKLVGVTGTNGKTTVSTLLYKLFTALGYVCGLISTIENKIGDQAVKSTHTTPDPLELNDLLAQMVEAGCEYVFMEVSSHAIHQNRIAGLQFTGGIFTNITHDHLDYHKTFDAYIAAKKLFFDRLPKSAFALVNADDKHGKVMLQNTAASRRLYSMRGIGDFNGKILESSFSGLVMKIDDQEVHSRLIGKFNAYNLLAVYAAACLLGGGAEEVLQAVSGLSGAEGRFDYIITRQAHITAIIDYAHTPDALKNVLQTIRAISEEGEQVITVIGCGGDRDKAKRPVMAQVATDLSDKVILTSDNPRSEDPAQILKDMEDGLNPASKRKVIIIENRKEAIKTACSLAGDGDIVLVAGKGHEKYQEIKGERHPFDDKEILRDTLQTLMK